MSLTRRGFALAQAARAHRSLRQAAAIKGAGGTDSNGIVKYVNSLEAGWPGLAATFKFSPTQHNGLPTKEIVMMAANSVKDGAYNLASGYSG